MIYLSGAIREELAGRADAGYMLTPMIGNILPERSLWASDTGMFAAPHLHDDVRYLGWLARLRRDQATCLFATAPDVFGDGPETLRIARPVLPIIRAMGYPAALVVQPGVTSASVPWGEIDAVFVGGPDDWQRSQVVQDIIDEARRRGVWRHQGRVNSERRLMAAAVRGFDSADGTFIAFAPDHNLPRVERWLTRAALQRRMTL